MDKARTEMEHPVICKLVEIRSSEYDTIAFKTMTTDRGGVSFMISQEDSNDYGKSFFFDGPEEARAFARRILDTLNAYIDPSPYDKTGGTS